MPEATHTCLGYAETQFLSITAVIADAMVKAADVSLLGLEPNGTEGICIRIGGASPAALQAALGEAESLAIKLGSTANCVCLAAPDPALRKMNNGPIVINGLYGGREEFRPSDFKKQPSNTMNKSQALGILETQGLTASLVASDAMFKAADVEFVGKEKIGAAYVTILIRGDVAAVNAAIEAGKEAAAAHGKVIATHTIARPHEDLAALLPG
jgi:carbon dioxide concentrating mechanism protein CcmO